MRTRSLAPLLLTGLLACADAPAPEPTASDKAPDGDAAKTAPADAGKDATAANAPTKAPPADGSANKPYQRPEPTALPADAHPALTDPTKATEQAPANYTCHFETTKGSFDIEVTRAWAPIGADRFYNLCKVGYFDGARFFRNIKGFMVQFGMSAYPDSTKAWKEATIQDDPVTQTNAPLMVTFAKTGKPHSRSTQIFINHGNNANLDSMGFAPFGRVTSGADVVGQLYTGYGEGAPRGNGPRQDILGAYGEAYLADQFPDLDTIQKTTIQ